MVSLNKNTDTMREEIDERCSIRCRNGWWSVIFSDSYRSPRQKEKSLKTKKKAAAYSRAVNMNKQWKQGLYDPWTHKDASISYSKALSHYLRQKPGNRDREINAGLVERICKENDVFVIAALSAEMIIKFIYQPHLSDGTKWSYRNKIGSVINWLSRKGYFIKNPMEDVPKVPEYETIPKHFTEEEFEEFLEKATALHEYNQQYTHRKLTYPLWYITCFELLAFTGIRPAATSRLTWDDVVWPEDTEDGIGAIYVKKTKTSKARTVTMHPRAERVFKYMEKNWRNSSDPSEPVLKNHTGKEPIVVKVLSDRMRLIRKWAKLKDVSLYDLRHTYAAYLRRRGLELHIISEEFGHKDYKTTQKYGKLGTNERMRSTFKKITE